jgi:hypothetical protein
MSDFSRTWGSAAVETQGHTGFDPAIVGDDMARRFAIEVRVYANVLLSYSNVSIELL